ncbi:hypothetical protein E2R58_15155 [Paenibacillus amylolyticus]|uniref:hypothetical protein n=1 Tax=Paenibacillus amylolyticus TaxID=1451 RepID=UPI0010594436|nr:hypothetical protein [Paenibacillus amylolyticus]TDL70416.1 hypothetical protein E2R58_15155 [Paenibacillus amylolyticus]
MNIFETILTAVASSAAVSALIAALFSKSNNDKNQSLKYVTEERGKWRQFIKESSSVIYSGNYKNDKEKPQLISQLILSLNPLNVRGNKLDLKIIDLLKTIQRGDESTQTLDEFRDCISILLKHDWERSKAEAGKSKQKIDEQSLKEILGEFYTPPEEREEPI